LDLKWSDFSKNTVPHLDSVQLRRALVAYHTHTVHTAWRYLQNPNPWIDARATFVETNPTNPSERYSTFKQYIPLIVLFYTAATDASMIGPEGYTANHRYEHFLKEICYINRAHNWDHHRINPITSEVEEYDEVSEGDRPSCYSGVKRRLFQSLLDHPLFNPVTLDGIYQELKDFLKPFFLSKLQHFQQLPLAVTPSNVIVSEQATANAVSTVFDEVKQAWSAWIEELDRSVLPTLRKLNLERISLLHQQFHLQMSNKYNESYTRDQNMVLKVQLFFANLEQSPPSSSACARAVNLTEEKVHVLELSGFIDFSAIFNQSSSAK
jgi:hypothetical protein